MIMGVDLRAVVILVLGIGFEGVGVGMRVGRIVVRVRMRVHVGVFVRMHGAVGMRMFVGVCMRMRIGVRVILAGKDFVARHVFDAVHNYVNLGCGDPGAFYAGDLEFGSDV